MITQDITENSANINAIVKMEHSVTETRDIAREMRVKMVGEVVTANKVIEAQNISNCLYYLAN